MMDDLRRPLHFSKMQGAGNSFLITWENISELVRARMAKLLCEPNFGIGADGMVFLNLDEDKSFSWDFYNSDGSTAEFCGNAARCAALSIFEQDSNIKKMAIKTSAGSVHCEIKNKHFVEVRMPKVEWLSKSLSLPMWPLPVAWLDTGVPHLVIEVQSLEELKKYKPEAIQMRSCSQVGRSGANVTFVFIQAPEKISAISFERGVEDFTLSCGTGAVAAASYVMAKHQTSDCQVEMPGGRLDVVIKGEQVLMTGEAHKIADLKLSEEFFQEDLA